jgi:hypothetical protein
MDDLDKFVQDLRCNMVTYLLKPEKKQGETVKSMVNKKLKSLDK